MSFSSEIKEELSRQMPTARHCQLAEIADFKLLRTCFGRGSRIGQSEDAYGKSGSCKKILYIIEKNI